MWVIDPHSVHLSSEGSPSEIEAWENANRPRSNRVVSPSEVASIRAQVFCNFGAGDLTAVPM